MFCFSFQEGTVDLSGENGNPMLINAGEGPIGTVTLMQPDSAMGNFNYVLIVQQPEAGDKQDMIDEQSKALLDEEQSRNLEVYEFDDNEEGNEIETMVGHFHVNFYKCIEHYLCGHC